MLRRSSELSRPSPSTSYTYASEAVVSGTISNRVLGAIPEGCTRSLQLVAFQKPFQMNRGRRLRELCGALGAGTVKG